MKKRNLVVLAFILMIPFVVFADTKPKVLTLEAEVSGSTINYSGTTESGSHAVMCKLYDSSDEFLGNLSVAVDGQAFSGSFTTTEEGDYTVACANYEGGDIKTATATVEDTPTPPEPPTPPTPTVYTVSFNSLGGTEISPMQVESGQTVAKPQDPINGERVFGGWFEDDTFAKEFDFNTPITGDIELFALWIDKVRVEFDTRCEQGMDPIEVMPGETISRPQDPVNGDKVFGGWFEDDTFTKEFDFNTPITNNITLVALWNDPVVEQVPYNVPDGKGNEASFTEEEGHSYTLTIVDYLSYTKEEVMSLAGITSEEYDQVFGAIKNAVKNEGTLVCLYEILLVDENNVEITDKEINIKLLLTDEMKKYKTLKLIYVKDDFTIEKPIILTVKGDYAYGRLKHLSMYTLVGTNTSNSTNNPNTNDNIYVWYGVLMISALGLSTTVYTANKKKK